MNPLKPQVMKPGVLIVDDDEEIRTQMKWAIAGEYEVLMAEDRASALEQFKAGRPKVTLLDLGIYFLCAALMAGCWFGQAKPKARST